MPDNALLPEASRPLAALLEPYFAPSEPDPAANVRPFLSTQEQLLEGSAVLLRCLIVLADAQVTREEEAHLVRSGAALFGDDEAVPFLRRLLRRLERTPIDRGMLGASMRHAYAPPTRKLMLLLAMEAALADGVVQAEEETLIHHLEGFLEIPEADAAVLRFVAAGDSRGAVGHLRRASANRAALRGLHGDLSPSGFAALRGCPGLHRTLQRAYAALDDLVRATDAGESRIATAPELDPELHAALVRNREEVERLGADLVQLRLAAGGPDLALVGGQLKALGEAHRRLAAGGLSVAVIGDFNSGKSTLLNAILGEEVLPTSGAPCTAAVTVVRYDAERKLTASYRSRPNHEETVDPRRYDEVARLPATDDFEAADETLDGLDLAQLSLTGPFPFCRSGVQLVDTPGLNEVARRTALTMRHLRESDVAVFLSNATHPLGAGERAVIARLLDDRPTMHVLLAATHWDQVAPTERPAAEARYQEYVAGLGARGSRVVLRFISAAKALTALRQRPTPVGDPWLGAFHEFRREMLGYLGRVRGPKQLDQLRGGMERVAEEAHSLAAVRLAELRGRDIAGAERGVREIGGAAAAIEAELTAAAEHFSAYVANRCAQFVDCAVLQLKPVAGRWKTTHDPRWPGNTARIRGEFELQAQRHFERSLAGWVRQQLPAMLADKVREIEARHAASLAVLNTALGALRAAPPVPPEVPRPQESVLLSLVRIAGAWPLLGSAGVLDVTWPQIAAAMGGQLGPLVVADLLGSSGQIAAAIAAGVGFVLMLRGKSNLVEKIREGVVEGMRQDRERIVQVAQDKCAEATSDVFLSLSAQIRKGLRRLAASGRTRHELVRDGSTPGSPVPQRLAQAQAACAAVHRRLAVRC